MDLPDHLMHYAVMATEDRVNSFLNERKLETEPGRRLHWPVARTKSRRSWGVTGLGGLVMTIRGAWWSRSSSVTAPGFRTDR